MMYKALYISPMVPSFDLGKTAAFFTDLLGFTLTMNTPQYAILQKDNGTIHLLPAGTDIGQMELYLEVNDLDVVWEQVKNRLDGIQHRGPFLQEYGMREIHIAVPHTNTLLFIGQVKPH